MNIKSITTLWAPLVLTLGLAAAPAFAVNISSLTTGGVDASQAAYTTASVSPKANRLILLTLEQRSNTGNTVSVAGNGLTWVAVNDIITDSSSDRTRLFRAMSSTTPSAGTIVATYSGGNPDRALWKVTQLDNVDTGGTNGSSAIVQNVADCSGGNAPTCTGNSNWTINLAAFGSTNNATYGTWGQGNSTPGAGTGFTQISYNTVGTSWDRLEAVEEFRPDNDTTVHFTLGFNSGGGIAAELKYAPRAEVRLKSFEAERTGGGVALTWTTGYEYDNVGFHVWRDDGGRWTQVDPSLIAGAALLGGPGIEVAGERTYSWFDAAAGSGTTRYMLEDVDRNGKSTYHGPAIAPAQTNAAVASGGGFWGMFSRPGAWWSSSQAAPLWAASSQGALGVGRGDSDLQPARRSSMLLSDIHADLTITADEATRRVGRAIDPVAPLTTRLVAQWDVTGKPGVRLSVDQEGWYRVSRVELEAAGLGRDVNPRMLRLWADGVEQPMIVRGELDGRFDAADTVEFYGTPLDTPWTGARIYWLTQGAPGATKRILLDGVSTIANAQGGASRAGSGGLFSSFKRFLTGGRAGGGVNMASRGKWPGNGVSFATTVERRDRSTYIAALQTSDGTPSFFGAVVTKKPTDQILRLSAIDLAALGEAKLEVNLQGITLVKHGVAVAVNGLPVGNVEWYGDQRGAFTARVPQQFLLEGDNRITLTAFAAENDINAVESVRLTYFRKYQAEGDALRFTAHGGKSVSIAGFSTPDVRVMDVTDPFAIVAVLGKVERKSGSYTVTLTPGRSGERTLYAFTSGGARHPVGIKEHRPSRAQDTTADLIIVTHESLRDSVAPLAALHQGQGLSVATAGVQDVYDAFSFGAKDPAALKAFFSRATFESGRRPRAVMLVGDASFDARNSIKKGDYDLIPTRLIATGSIQTASDDWFTDFDNNGVPDVAIGRLPARTAADLGIMVGKIVTQERSKGAWNHSTLLVADARTASDSQIDFAAISSALAADAPAGWKIDKVFKPQTGAMTTMKSELLARLNEGPGVVNYVGHGSVSVWRGNTLTGADAMALTNGSRLPFVAAMTCLNGFFQDVYSESLAESLLKAPRGGAVAVWASSALTSAESQTAMNRDLQSAIYHGGNLPLGEMVMRAKASAGDGDVSRTWILFGDPLTTIF